MPTIIAYAVLAAVSFLLHGVWERVHIVLYTNYGALEGHLLALEGALPVYLFATFGDVMYTFLAVFTIAVVKRDAGWMGKARARDYSILAAAGFCIAVFVEIKAQMLGRWEYADAMPLIYGFGLSPLVQMTVLLPLSVYVSAVVSQWLKR